jgi:hypothetical protein
MNQWLNRLVTLIVVLLLATTLFIAAQNPAPGEIRRPTPSPTVTPQPTATPTTRPARAISDLPLDRQGMLLATQPDGTLRLISQNGERSWTLDLPQRLAYAAWSPDGLHIVGATIDGNALITHPERQDSHLLLERQRLTSGTPGWRDPLTVALSYVDESAPGTVALWSYRNRSLEPIGSGQAPAAAFNGPIAWIALDNRSIVFRPDNTETRMLVSAQQLDRVFPSRQPDAVVEVAHSHNLGLVWSPPGSRLAFAASSHREGVIVERAIVVATPGDELRHWTLPAASPIYQLSWLSDSRLLFTDDQGLAAIDVEAGSITRLLPEYPAVRYFAISLARNTMILSLPDGLFSLPISNLELPQEQLQPFGLPISGYQRLDWCCITVPRSDMEP